MLLSRTASTDKLATGFMALIGGDEVVSPVGEA